MNNVKMNAIKSILIDAANESNQKVCDCLAELVDECFNQDCENKEHVSGIEFARCLNDLAISRFNESAAC